VDLIVWLNCCELQPAVVASFKISRLQSQGKKDLNAGRGPRQTVLTWFRKDFKDAGMAKLSDNDPGKKGFVMLSRKAVAGWVVVVFIISGWMFGVGVMVGRGTAPIGFELDKLKHTLESMQKAAQPAPKSGPRSQSSEMKNKTDLGFYESLPKNREDADLPTLPPAPPAARQPPAAPKPAEAAASAKAEKPAAPPAPVSAKAETPAAASAPQLAPVPGKPMTVQVAAVKSEEEARQFAERLRQKGYAAYIEPIAIPEKGVWFRVRMGEFPSKEFARSTMERLQKDGFAPAVVPK
jgi:cell division septation protein DedD